MRNIGFAVQRRMACDFSGDAEAMRRDAVAWLGRQLKMAPSRFSRAAQPAFADFAAVLLFIPDLPRWTAEEKNALGKIIAAKAGRTELRYLRLLQKHPRLRATILKLGL
jgi:hypothetical protein